MTQPSVRKLAPELKQYEFLVVSRFEPVRRCKLKLPDP
jgi:hypothetical protein